MTRWQVAYSIFEGAVFIFCVAVFVFLAWMVTP